MTPRLFAFSLCALLAFSALSGCASQTLIESRPAGATVLVDGDRYVGQTPVRVQDLPRLGQQRQYQISKEGYYPRVIQLAGKVHQRHVLACICTVGMAWPLLLFAEYPSNAVITLERRQSAPRAHFSPEPSVHFGH